MACAHLELIYDETPVRATLIGIGPVVDILLQACPCAALAQVNLRELLVVV